MGAPTDEQDSQHYAEELRVLVQAFMDDSVTLGVACNLPYHTACRKVLKGNVSKTQKQLMSGFADGLLPTHLLVKLVRHDALEPPRWQEEQAMRDFNNKLRLLLPVETIWKYYFDIPQLLSERPMDVGHNMSVEVIKHVGIMVWLWFSEWDRGTPVTAWSEFCGRLLSKCLEMPWCLERVGSEGGELERRLEASFDSFREAVDLALESLLRMHVALDFPYQRILKFRGAQGEPHPYLLEAWFWRGSPDSKRLGPPGSFVAFIRSLIPPTALHERHLPRTRRAIEKYMGRHAARALREMLRSESRDNISTSATMVVQSKEEVGMLFKQQLIDIWHMRELKAKLQKLPADASLEVNVHVAHSRVASAVRFAAWSATAAAGA